MKKNFFLLTLLLSGLILNAQNKQVIQTPTTTKPVINLSQSVEKNKTPNGSALVYNERGKFKVYASFSNSKITGYYAIDGNGKRTDATYVAASSVYCEVCISGDAGQKVCYQVDCAKIPLPKTNKAN